MVELDPANVLYKQQQDEANRGENWPTNYSPVPSGSLGQQNYPNYASAFTHSRIFIIQIGITIMAASFIISVHYSFLCAVFSVLRSVALSTVCAFRWTVKPNHGWRPNQRIAVRPVDALASCPPGVAGTKTSLGWTKTFP